MITFQLTGPIVRIEPKRVMGDKNQFVSRVIVVEQTYALPPRDDGTPRDPRVVPVPVTFDGDHAAAEVDNVRPGDRVEVQVIPYGLFSKKKDAYYVQVRAVRNTLKVTEKAVKPQSEERETAGDSEIPF